MPIVYCDILGVILLQWLIIDSTHYSGFIYSAFSHMKLIHTYIIDK